MKIPFFQMLPSIAMRVKALQPRSELHDEEESNETCLHRLPGREKRERPKQEDACCTCAVYMLNTSQLTLPCYTASFSSQSKKIKEC